MGARFHHARGEDIACGNPPDIRLRRAMEIAFRSIGIVKSPFKTMSDMPVQPVSDSSADGLVEIDPSYEAGLSDLDGFSHLILIYHVHKATAPKLKVLPFLDTVERGVFSTRAPSRPNAIGLSIVGLRRVEKNRLFVTRLDILDGTPLLDIKPYVPEFDSYPDARGGWFERTRGSAQGKRSDGRFT